LTGLVAVTAAGGPWVWIAALTVNATIAAAFALISRHVAVGLTRSRQWRANALGAATVLIFGCCALGHADHVLRMAVSGLPSSAFASGLLAICPIGSIDTALTTPLLGGSHAVWNVEFLAVDAFTAFFAVFYWRQRSRFPEFARGAALFEDLVVLERDRFRLQSGVVDGIAAACVAIDRGDPIAARRNIDRALESSRTLITELLPDGPVVPGDARRRDRAGAARVA